jgi:hypothetical protein
LQKSAQEYENKGLARKTLSARIGEKRKADSSLRSG